MQVGGCCARPPSVCSEGCATMAAMKVEQEEERERLEDARRRAQSVGDWWRRSSISLVTRTRGCAPSCASLRLHATTRRSVDVSIDKQVDLKRDLLSALSELEVPAPLSAPSLGALPRRSLGALPRRPPSAPHMHLSSCFPHPTALSAPPQSPFNPSADPAARAQPTATVRGQAAPHNRRAARAPRAAAVASIYLHEPGPLAAGRRVFHERAPAVSTPNPSPKPNLTPHPNPSAQPKPKPGARARPSTAYSHTGAGSAAYGQRPGMLRSAAPRSQTTSSKPSCAVAPAPPPQPLLAPLRRPKPRPTIHAHLTKQAAVARATAGKVLASRCAPRDRAPAAG